MRYKKFGNTDMNVSALTVGTWAIGGSNWGAIDENDSIAAIHAMLDNGVNMIDTAPAYNFGNSERVVGKALQGRRDKVYVTTKTAVYNTKEIPFIKDGRKETILRLCDESLQNLQTDYIDLMILHWPDIEHNAPLEEQVEALEILKSQGKIRYYGVSNYDQALIEEISKYGTISALQPPYSMVNRSSEELMKWTASRGIANMTYGSLGAGILTGAIRELPNFAPDDMRLTFYDFFREPKFSQVMKLLKVMDEIAAAHNAPVAQVAVNWNSQKDWVSTSLCGVRNPQEAIDNCAGFQWSLTDEEMVALDKAIEEYL